MEILFAILIGYCIFIALGYFIAALIFIIGVLLATIVLFCDICWQLISQITTLICPKSKNIPIIKQITKSNITKIAAKPIKQYTPQEKIEFAIGLIAIISLLMLIWVAFTTSIATDILIGAWIIFNVIVACIGTKLLDKFKNQ